jgi:ribosome-binding factor A
MSTGRMRRVDEAIRQVVGEAAGELKDPRVGFVTVTDVRTSADLSHARVYVSVLGDEPVRDATLDGLRSAHGFLQRRVASELRLKRTPALAFLYDDTTDRALRIDELIERETPARGEGEASVPGAHERPRDRASADAGGAAGQESGCL